MSSSFNSLVADLADSFDAIAARLRRYIAEEQVEASRAPEVPFVDRLVEAARRFHVSIGPRQLEAVRLIAAAHPEGVGTGQLMREMHVDQPNVYLTLKSLVERKHKLLRKDSASVPHRYYLSEELLREAGEA